MAIRSKSAIAAFFESGDKPTQQQFADFIDSCVFIPTAGATGVVEVESTASTTTRTLGAFGVQIIGAATTASAQSLVGGADFSTVGRSIASAATTASAQDRLGIGAVGRSLFEASTTASVVGGMVESISGMIESPASGQNYVLDHAASYPYTINSLIARTSAGTGTVAVKVNGTNITGLSAVGVSAGGSNSAAATGGNSVAASARVTMVITGVASAVDLGFTIKTTRT